MRQLKVMNGWSHLQHPKVLNQKDNKLTAGGLNNLLNFQEILLDVRIYTVYS